jgi:hypothetical protein
MGRIMVVQPPDEEAEAEAEGGDRHAAVFPRVCAVPVFRMASSDVSRDVSAIVTVAGRGYFEGVCDK